MQKFLEFFYHLTWILVIPGNECEEFYQPGEDLLYLYYSTIFLHPTICEYIAYPSNYTNMWGLYAYVTLYNNISPDQAEAQAAQEAALQAAQIIQQQQETGRRCCFQQVIRRMSG